MTTTTTPTAGPATTTFDYTYGDSITPVSVPLPNDYRYTNGQQALVDHALDRGWELDTTAISNTYGYRFDELPAERRAAFLKQHPFKFVRPAADGNGHWQITLDYLSREYSHHGSRGFNKTLKGARLRRFYADGTTQKFDEAVSGYVNYNYGRHEIVLQQQSTASYASTNWVWAAALVGEGYSIRERVQALLDDPDGIVELAYEKMATAAARAKAARDEAERIRNLKARPLPRGWGALARAARAVNDADGMSDTEALLAALKAAVAAVEDEVVAD